MVRLPRAIDSATSQFLVNVADNEALDFRNRTPEGYGYCVFGQVIAGMDVVDKINQAPTHDTADIDRTPIERIVVKSMRQNPLNWPVVRGEPAAANGARQFFVAKAKSTSF